MPYSHVQIIGLVFVVFVANIPPVQAQDTPDAQVQSNIQFTLSGAAAHQYETDIDDGGDLDVTRAGSELEVKVKVNEQVGVNSLFSYELSNYDFSGSTGFGGLDPWDNIHQVMIRPAVTLALDQQSMLFGSLMLILAKEDGADENDSFTAGGAMTYRRRVSETLNWGLGITVMDQIEEDAMVLPVFILNWRFAEQWTLRTGSSRLATPRGFGVEVGWAFAENWELAFGTHVQNRRFRLDGSGLAPDGVGEETSIPVYAKLAYQINPNASVYLMGGVVAAGEVRLENSGGHKISEQDYDPAGMIGVCMEVQF